jgi:hypothetical protein
VLRLAALVVLAAALGAQPAAAEQPCWKVLVDDWYDGHVDGIYEAACYREALASLPEDGAYGFANGRADLERGLRLAVARESGREEEPAPYRAPLVGILLAVAGIVAMSGSAAWALDRRRAY